MTGGNPYCSFCDISSRRIETAPVREREVEDHAVERRRSELGECLGRGRDLNRLDFVAAEQAAGRVAKCRVVFDDEDAAELLGELRLEPSGKASTSCSRFNRLIA